MDAEEEVCLSFAMVEWEMEGAPRAKTAYMHEHATCMKVGRKEPIVSMPLDHGTCITDNSPYTSTELICPCVLDFSLEYSTKGGSCRFSYE